MQVNMISFNSISEASVKQDSRPASNDNSFKSAVNNTIQKSKESSTSKSQVQTSNLVKSGEDVKGEEKQSKDGKDTNDINDNLSILLSQLLSGKINFKELTTSLKDEVQSLIKSNINITGVDDKKLSDAVTNLFENLLSGQEKMNNQNLPKLTDDKINISLSQFNDQIIKLLEDTNTSANIDNNAVSKVLDEVDKGVLSALKAETPSTNTVSIDNSYNDILYALRTKMNAEESKAKVELAVKDSDVKNNTNTTKDTYKTTQSSSGQDLKTVAENSSMQGQLTSSSDDKKQDLDSNTGDGFLKKLISSDKDSKFSKVSNFMTQFNNIKSDVPVVDNGSITINKGTFSSDLFKAINYMDANGIKDLTVKIAPKELGEVTIKLTMENGVMKASITASNKDAYNLLNSSIKDISDKLQDTNIKIHNFDINVYEDTTFFKDSSNNQSRQQYRGSKGTNSIKGITDEESAEDNLSTSEDSVLNTLV
jgi:flagellar hook-length control protein FliK